MYTSLNGYLNSEQLTFLIHIHTYKASMELYNIVHTFTLTIIIVDYKSQSTKMQVILVDCDL